MKPKKAIPVPKKGNPSSPVAKKGTPAKKKEKKETQAEKPVSKPVQEMSLRERLALKANLDFDKMGD